MGIACAWAEAELAELEPLGLRRRLEPLEGPQGAVVRIGGEPLINFSSNDYLGLAGDARLGKAASSAWEVDGMGSGASRLVVGDLPAHRALEEVLARFEKSETALLFNNGYTANVGVVSSLVGKDDVVFSDALNHASLVDGCRLSRAKVEIYPHLDVGALAAKLRGTVARRKLVVTDGVFSMDGDSAPLSELVALCRAEGAALMVDEAHATGVLGPTGAGLCEAMGVEGEVDVRMGTLGKALGVFGAYVACAEPLRELLFNRARSLIYSTSLPPSVCRAAHMAVEVVMAEPSLRERLWRNIHHFSEGLRALGVPAEPRSAIFPLVLGEPRRALEAAGFLRARGVLAKPIRPPSVPVGTSRLRFALSAAHTPAHIDRALEALKEGGFTRGGAIRAA